MAPTTAASNSIYIRSKTRAEASRSQLQRRKVISRTSFWVFPQPAPLPMETRTSTFASRREWLHHRRLESAAVDHADAGRPLGVRVADRGKVRPARESGYPSEFRFSDAGGCEPFRLADSNGQDRNPAAPRSGMETASDVIIDRARRIRTVPRHCRCTVRLRIKWPSRRLCREA